ncbi:MAG: pilus assembly protein PilM [Candidatus Eremiobacteraeota bacterium]|nr:pilus assembly protein PilM [Candidatus Eremiobacteraeota bacterium]
MKNVRTLPLGIDFGSTRVRIALSEAAGDSQPRILSVVSRNLSESPASAELTAALLEEMLDELEVRERRCVLALRSPSAAIRAIHFPRMSAVERNRAARFEARRFANWNLDEEPSDVRVHPIDRSQGVYAVGAVRRDALDALLKPAKLARLKVIAIDHDAFALRRSFAQYDGVLDVGLERTALHAYGDDGPMSWLVASGGAEITRGIARDLAIDFAAAEKRKCILGSAGAGASACRELVAHVSHIVERARGRTRLSRIALTGNGVRLPGLQAQLAAATSAIIEMPVSDLLRSDAYPDDVVRSAAPDWTLAAALSGWTVAA